LALRYLHSEAGHDEQEQQLRHPELFAGSASLAGSEDFRQCDLCPYKVPMLQSQL
jgi:hypothetical protein